MLTLLLTVAVAQPGLIRFEPRRSDQGFAYFEFAPAGGTGMGTACACTTPTGAKGETLTFTRASSGTCLTGGTTSGIANGSMVTCSSNQPRVMPGGDGTGALGLLVEGARTNLTLRSAELCDVAWADVGTPACASDAAAGPFGTTTMDSITDDSGAAFEGRSQAITTTSATQHSVSCFVKSSTATSASITLVGTGSSAGDCTGTATGLSTTTSTRVTCSSPAAYAGTLTSVTLTIRVGTVVGDTGVLYVEGCQHEVAAAFPSSYIATTAASVTRAAETPTFPVSATLAESSGSAAATVLALLNTGTIGGVLTFGPSQRPLAFNSGGTTPGGISVFDSTAVVITTAGSNFNQPHRVWSSWSGSTMTATNTTDNLTASGAFDGTMQGASTSLEIGNNAGGAGPFDGVIKRVCLDPSPARCR